MTIKHVNLFSCIGGLPLGFESVNEDIHTVLLYEPNRLCRNVLEHFWDVPIATEVNELTEGVASHEKSGGIDIISARHRGRNWPIILATVAQARPKIVVIEGMASLRSRGLVRLLKDLRALGYDAEGHVISARSLGAIYNGERFWVIAYPDADGLAPDSVASETEGRLGKQYVTHDLLNEYRAWLEGNGQTSRGAVFGQPRLLRRDDALSRRVDAARVRLLSDDASPLVSSFIGLCVANIITGKFQPIAPKLMTVTDHVRNATKRTNLINNTAKIVETGVPFTVRNGGMHLVIKRPCGKFIDYWPSTDIYIVRGTKDRGFGVDKVILRVTQGVAP